MATPLGSNSGPSGEVLYYGMVAMRDTFLIPFLRGQAWYNIAAVIVFSFVAALTVRLFNWFRKMW